MSARTLSTVVSVEWCALYADCRSGRRLLSLRYVTSCLATSLSSNLDSTNNYIIIQEIIKLVLHSHRKSEYVSDNIHSTVPTQTLQSTSRLIWLVIIQETIVYLHYSNICTDSEKWQCRRGLPHVLLTTQILRQSLQAMLHRSDNCSTAFLTFRRINLFLLCKHVFLMTGNCFTITSCAYFGNRMPCIFIKKFNNTVASNCS